MLGLGNSLTGGFSSDEFLPSDISNLTLWFKNATGLTGDPVSRWDDQSGNGSYMVQSSSGNRGDLIGGGIHLEADNSDHYDFKDSSDSALDITMSANHNFLIGFVITMESTTAANCLLSDDSNEFIDIQNAAKLRVNCTGETAAFEASSDQFADDTQVAVVISRNNGSTGTIQVFIDGAQKDGMDDVNRPEAIEFSILGARVGSSRFFDGTVHEMVIYDLGTGTHTAGELTSLNSYFTSKFGL